MILNLPAQVEALVKPFEAQMIGGFHRAFSITLANSLWLGVGALVVAVVSVSLLHELPLRQHFGAAEAIGEGLAGPQSELVAELE